MLVVCRVKCSQCGKTHAILPSSIVPYSQITLACCCRIISDYNNNQNVYSSCEDYPDVDENNVKSVIRRFLKHWKQRLISESIHLFPIRTLILACFSCYSAQFMQIHRTLNIPHLKTT